MVIGECGFWVGPNYRVKRTLNLYAFISVENCSILAKLISLIAFVTYLIFW